VKYSKAPEMRRDRLNNADISVDKVKADNYACLIIVHLVHLVTKGRLLDLHKSVPQIKQFSTCMTNINFPEVS